MASQAFKIGCFREFQNSIDDSVHALLSAEIERLKMPGFNVMKTEIAHRSGGQFKFRGLARNIASVKSMHGFRRFWIEEAQTTSKDSLKELTPTIRTDDSEIWFSLNPQSAADPVSERFLEPFMKELLAKGYYEDDLHLVIWINYYDNPWFPESLEQERLWDYENLPRNLYNHIWLGHYNDTIDNAIIPVEWFEAAINAHERLGFKPRGVKILAHDPSDSGDPRAIAVRHGSVILDADINESLEVNEACDWALNEAIDRNVDLFTWDCDGLGLSLRRQVADSLDGKRIDYQMFKGSDGPDFPDEVYQGDGWTFDKTKEKTNRQVFKNKRAQYYWGARDRFYNTYRAVIKGEYIDPDKLISISPEIKRINQLRTEMCRIPRKHNPNGLIQIMNKQDMKKLKINSPNLADSVMMSFVTPGTEEETVKNIKFDSLW